MSRIDEPRRTLIDALLEEQQLLTAAARFARHHEAAAEPHQARYYRDLIPLDMPKHGEQYAFEVDLDRCSGCKACVTACHSLNGLSDEESWRSTGLLRVNPYTQPWQRTVTTACHHCVDPACLNGCPVDAYEKNPLTGIVRHLDDQCIGCQYCILKCPYDVPRYNAERGIVRKCDMCGDRLAAGEAPACVQACPNEAIQITIVAQDAVRERYQHADDFLPGAPASEYTLPTTRFVSQSPAITSFQEVEADPPAPQPSHPALVFMLVLTQFSVGLFCAAEFLRFSVAGSQHVPVANSAAALGLLGLVASVFHLGRPMYAFRALIGLRHSWLSREVLAFGIFAALAIARVLLPDTAGIGAAVVFAGFAGVLCSVMIYHDTRRAFWKGLNTAGKFFGTTVLLGTAGAWTFSPRPQLACVLILLTLAKLIWEGGLLARPQLALSAQVVWGPLRRFHTARFAFGILGGVILPLAFLAGTTTPALALASLILCVAGEFAERFTFFAAAAPIRMPGAPA
jgi:formate dehydrogenase iron-sulfur subunit